MAEDNRIERLTATNGHQCFQGKLGSQPWYLPM